MHFLHPSEIRAPHTGKPLREQCQEKVRKLQQGGMRPRNVRVADLLLPAPEAVQPMLLRRGLPSWQLHGHGLHAQDRQDVQGLHRAVPRGQVHAEPVQRDARCGLPELLDADRPWLRQAALRNVRDALCRHDRFQLLEVQPPLRGTHHTPFCSPRGCTCKLLKYHSLRKSRGEGTLSPGTARATTTAPASHARSAWATCTWHPRAGNSRMQGAGDATTAGVRTASTSPNPARTLTRTTSTGIRAPTAPRGATRTIRSTPRLRQSPAAAAPTEPLELTVSASRAPRSATPRGERQASPLPPLHTFPCQRPSCRLHATQEFSFLRDCLFCAGNVGPVLE